MLMDFVVIHFTMLQFVEILALLQLYSES